MVRPRILRGLFFLHLAEKKKKTKRKAADKSLASRLEL